VPARVERWFAESNYHHQEFADTGAGSFELKARQGGGASLTNQRRVLPTHNEAATIGSHRHAHCATRRSVVRFFRCSTAVSSLDSDWTMTRA
jgi:hypothetical protein